MAWFHAMWSLSLPCPSSSLLVTDQVGNTTVIASRIAPSPFLNDPGYMYMEGVKVHEYYHNINGAYGDESPSSSPFPLPSAGLTGWG